MHHFHANEETNHVFKEGLNFTQFSRCSYFEIIGIEHAQTPFVGGCPDRRRDVYTVFLAFRVRMGNIDA